MKTILCVSVFLGVLGFAVGSTDGIGYAVVLGLAVFGLSYAALEMLFKTSTNCDDDGSAD